MNYVNTVTGPVAASELGRTLMHEHFLFGFCGFQGDATLGGFKEEEYTRDCLKAVDDARAYGMNIICSTGYYFQAESAYAYWNFRRGFANIEEEIYEMMVTELTKGIEGTDIKAGVIKLASSFNEITPTEEIFFKAAARAQKETGCVIITHTQLGTMGPEQAQLLIANGADPSKIAIGHMCGSTDVAYHEAVLKQGVYVNLDRFGLEGELFHTPTDEQRMDLIKTLSDKGYGNKILLGHDSVNVNLGRGLIMTPFMEEAMKWANITDIGARVLPGLAKRGMTEEQIDALLAANPMTIFG